MNLIIDQGNTRTKFAYFEENRLTGTASAENTDAAGCLIAIVGSEKFDMCMFSTVVSGSKLPQLVKEKNIPFWELNTSTKLPFKNLYKTPQTLGKDRLAAIAGAYALHPGKNCLVIDAGTAITYDFINSDGEYCGGSITPGIKMRAKALHQFTSKLPEVEINKTADVIGTDTISALQSGILFGIVHEIDGFIRYYKGNAGELLVFLTGGDALLFDKHIKNSIFVAQNLVVTGLNSLLEHNAH